MRALDAILLESLGPIQPPPPAAPQSFEVWIALRADGSAGSGTEGDPFDGSVRANLVLNVSGITFSGTEATATATNHGYTNGAIIVIAGATGTDAPLYNGTFPINGVTTNSFKYQMRATPGASAMGTITCTLDPYRFDAVMRGLPDVAGAIRLGPGIFETKGFSALAPASWRPRAGWKISGLGMSGTTVKLVGAQIPGAFYAAIGHSQYTSRVNDAEVRDLTVDCNYDGQPVPTGWEYPPVTCAAVFLAGKHTRIRRVRAIHFGGPGPTPLGPQATINECFVTSSAWAVPWTLPVDERVNCVIEDSVAEKPSINGTTQVTILNMGAAENPDGVMGYHRGCIIRTCLVDSDYQRNPVPVSGLTSSGTVATVTTALPHDRLLNTWLRISGALVNGSFINPFNGSFKITSATTNQFQYTLPQLPAAQPSTGSQIWVDRFPSAFVAVAAVAKLGSSGAWVVRLTTTTPHFRVPGERVLISGILVGGSVSDKFNGHFLIEDDASHSATVFNYRLPIDPDPGSPQVGAAFVGVALQGTSNDGGSGAVVEGNSLVGTRLGGPYHDTFNSKDLNVRNNYYGAVVTGPYQNMGGMNAPKNSASLTRVGTIATLTSMNPHGLLPGQAVWVENARVSGVLSPLYNGFFSILAVPGSNQFTYQMAGDPGASADASPKPTFRTLWQCESLIFENNQIELIGSTNGFGPPVAVALTRYQNTTVDFQAQRIYKRVLAQENAIRQVEGLTDVPGIPSLAVVLDLVGNGLVRYNVIALPETAPMQHRAANSLTYFGNTAPSGGLIQGVDTGLVGSPKVNELTTDVADAAILAY